MHFEEFILPTVALMSVISIRQKRTVEGSHSRRFGNLEGREKTTLFLMSLSCFGTIIKKTNNPLRTVYLKPLQRH
ncbi:hypothetical protein MAR_019712 [Mya arenaria]|uniref:Uncharacterized protein n=1 Tax=Mya arenaria TaxID=6604 RepID=A0ABY7E6D0_MYAAR|nr:hypothetical protein MAR_019712 [Mya arenaria]